MLGNFSRGCGLRLGGGILVWCVEVFGLFRCGIDGSVVEYRSIVAFNGGGFDYLFVLWLSFSFVMWFHFVNI